MLLDPRNRVLKRSSGIVSKSHDPRIREIVWEKIAKPEFSSRSEGVVGGSVEAMETENTVGVLVSDIVLGIGGMGEIL